MLRREQTREPTHARPENVVIEVEFDLLLEAEKLLRPRWGNVAALVLAARGPTRFADLNRAMIAYSRRQFSDTKLTITLNQLRDGGYVRREIGEDDHLYWTLTPDGVQRAATLRGVVRCLAQARAASDACESERAL